MTEITKYKKILVTGGAGFIGSHIVTELVRLKIQVIVVDNEFNGKKENLKQAYDLPSSDIKYFKLDIRSKEFFDLVLKEKPDIVFHEAAVASVPRSVKDPRASLDNNVMGTLNLLLACKDAGVKRVVFASSSSVYGDDTTLPKVEEKTGKVLSPYALSKQVGEELLRLFYELYGLETVSLRYFNVFGPRQDPKGPYAAVIPIFSNKILNNQNPVIYGDGEQSRDFTFVEDVVKANFLFATLPKKSVAGKVFNVALGGEISVNQLAEKINKLLNKNLPPIHEPERKGDIKDSCADISKSKSLGFKPSVTLDKGLEKTVNYYKENS